MKSSKGQRVKTFKTFIPNADLTKTETQVVVYFQADGGQFSIFDGAHMFNGTRDDISDRSLHIFVDRITAKTLDTIVQGFTDICTAYEHRMRDALKKKVIRFTFKRNVKWDGEHQAYDDISFCGSPAVHITYEVLYQVGDNLYFKHPEEEEEKKTSHRLQYRGKATEARFRDGDAVTIDWTEEREAFFENMQASLLALIHRVDDFQKNLLVNVDHAIAANSMLMLEHKKS